MRRLSHAPMLACLSLFVLTSGFWACKSVAPKLETSAERITLPERFQIEVYAAGVKNARQMCLGPEGTIFVGTKAEGSVYAIQDLDGDHHADTLIVLAKGLNMPNGVAFREGSLFVAEVNRILRWDRIMDKLASPGLPVVVQDSLPDESHHGWKYIAFGPDGKLYVPVGAPCNVCDRPDDPRFASILRMNPDGSEMEVYAHGIRNTVGFGWHPQTKELWFTDNGRDWLGDNGPNDELNLAPKAGMHFGFPYCHAGSIPDPEFGNTHPCNEFVAPAQKLGAHVAALGLMFYQGSMFPPEYKNKVFICEHGSWNSSVPVGYRVSTVDIEGGKCSNYRPFAAGWLDAEVVWGRPVAMLELPDGSVLLSDDHGNQIYRITYGN
jgi:glucose/arabinose dehydrogenase